MEHKLKISPECFCEVAAGRKSFEIRKDDREPPFTPCDTLLLEEYIDGKYSGRWIRADVTLVLRNKYCKEGYCVMSIVPTGGNGFRPPTNADRIRAMSAEALAAWIILMQRKDLTEKWCNNPECWERMDEECFSCTDELLAACIIRWLNQVTED